MSDSSKRQQVLAYLVWEKQTVSVLQQHESYHKNNKLLENTRNSSNLH